MLKFRKSKNGTANESVALRFDVDFDFTSQVLREKHQVFVHHTLR